MSFEVTWNAVYNDGTSLPQHSEDGSVNKYPDIDRSKLEFFELNQNGKLILKLHLEKGQGLVYRRRTVRNLATGKDKIIWMVSSQYAHITDPLVFWAFENGSLECTSGFKDEPFGSHGDLMECEKQLIGDE